MITVPIGPKTEFVAVALHPSYAFKGMPQALPWITHTIRRARLFATIGMKRPTAKVTFPTTKEQLRTYLERCGKHPRLYDIETPGKHEPHRIKLVGICGIPGEAVVVPWSEEFQDTIQADLLRTDVLKVGHNFAFDQAAFFVNGIDIAWPVADTIQREALLCPPFKEAKKRRWLSLGASIARRVPGWPYHKEAELPIQKALYRAWFPGVPESLYEFLYCGLDCIGNMYLYLAQTEALERAGMLKLFKEIVAPAAYHLVRMELRGIPIDAEKKEKILDATTKLIAELDTKILAFTEVAHAQRIRDAQAAYDKLFAERAAIVDKRSAERKALTPRIAKIRTKLKQIGERFDSENDNHWRWLLFSETGLDLTPVRVTETGIPGVKRDDIEQLQQLYPEVQILEWRVSLQHALHKVRVLNNLPIINGRAFFAFSLHKTENGRFASGLDEEEEDKIRESQGGNAQNITEEDRKIFVAPEGFTWVDLDLKQVELRDMAWLAEEWDLIRILLGGGDIHSENGAAIFGCPPEDARKFKVWFEGRIQSARDGGKKASHGWDYGMGDAKSGRMFRPFHGQPFETVLEFLAVKASVSGGLEGMTPESWKRRQVAAARAPEPEAEARKLRLRIVDMANTLKAREWRAAYFRKWRKLAEFQRKVIAMIEQDRQLRNTFGRVLQFWNFEFDWDTKRWILQDREEALAFWPASDVGDMAKVLLPFIAKCATMFGGELVTMTHDSFSCLIPTPRVGEFIPAAKAIMERTWPQYKTHPEFGAFWVPCDVSVGGNWGKFNAETNPDGLKEWKGDNASQATPPAGTEPGAPTLRGGV